MAKSFGDKAGNGMPRAMNADDHRSGADEIDLVSARARDPKKGNGCNARATEGATAGSSGLL
jgi:hypothetical protein